MNRPSGFSNAKATFQPSSLLSAQANSRKTAKAELANRKTTEAGLANGMTAEAGFSNGKVQEAETSEVDKGVESKRIKE